MIEMHYVQPKITAEGQQAQQRDAICPAANTHGPGAWRNGGGGGMEVLERDRFHPLSITMVRALVYACSGGRPGRYE